MRLAAHTVQAWAAGTWARWPAEAQGVPMRYLSSMCQVLLIATSGILGDLNVDYSWVHQSHPSRANQPKITYLPSFETVRSQ